MGGWQGVMVVVTLVGKLNAELDFAVHVKEGGGAEAADRIARKHGMKNMGEVSRSSFNFKLF